jgi:hypothetical protein
VNEEDGHSRHTFGEIKKDPVIRVFEELGAEVF